MSDNPLNHRPKHTEKMHAGPPLDLSFKKASTIDELAKHSAHTSRISKLPTKTNNDRFLTSSLWLSNNLLNTTARLDELASRFLANPQDLRWLDLAFNCINDFNDDLFKFKKLTILYLHGNKISDIRNIVKLRKLTHLRTLTLHGNPIEDMPDYRRYVIAILPQILNLDFSPVIEAEKRRALPVGFFKTIQNVL